MGVPEFEGRVHDKSTSGSTGEPSVIKKTDIHFRINAIENERLKRNWPFRTQTGQLQTRTANKDHPPGSVENTGPSPLSNNWRIYHRDPKQVRDLLLRTKCSHISSMFPTELVALLEILPPVDFLKLVSTIGEIIPPELPELVAQFPGCLHYDAYGSVETGIIAGKCRGCGHYHLAKEHLLVEILNEQGTPVPSGTIGRVIATPLFNLAMPLLRYETGDYAIPISNLQCSISNHGLSRIVGRKRNLFLHPDGSRIMPHLAVTDIMPFGIRKFKLVQITQQDIEFRYVPLYPDITITAEDIQPLIDNSMSPLFRVRPVRVSEIKPQPGGKYFLHESLLGD